MTKDEALKQALEALERMKQHSYLRLDYAEQAITAINEALAQPPLPVQPVQRPWVGLTDDEIKDALVSVDTKTKRLPPGMKAFAQAVEAKLKEKNT
jgi:hypothetical protein